VRAAAREFPHFFAATFSEPSAKQSRALSMSKNWTHAEYDTHGGRARAVSLLQRYSYVLGQI